MKNKSCMRYVYASVTSVILPVIFDEENMNKRNSIFNAMEIDETEANILKENVDYPEDTVNEQVQNDSDGSDESYVSETDAEDARYTSENEIDIDDERCISENESGRDKTDGKQSETDDDSEEYIPTISKKKEP